MSEEKSKGISLRKKKATTTRPKISAPVIISQPNDSTPSLLAPDWNPSRNGSESNASVSRARLSASGPDKTADLVKRRYSTRFAQYPVDTESPPPMPGVPAIPQLATKYASSKASSRGNPSPERREGQRLKVDLKAFRDPDLQAEQYVAKTLADATEDDIYNYQSELQSLKTRTSTDLQHNVYQNRTQFIKISKEADKLKSEMRTLRTLMSELTGVLGHAATAGSQSDANAQSQSDRKRSNRTSVANLEALWSTHLQALWKRVEGSQKYLPAVSGRHVVHESGRWVELNTATWKPRRRVHLILLNDHLLFASEKQRLDPSAMSPNPQSRRQSTYQPPTQTHLVAEHCWPLQDVHMADISTRPADSYLGNEKSTMSNAVNVRVANESWTFAATSGADCSADTAVMLIAFKKAVEDLRKSTAAEHGDRERALDELAFLTGDPRLLKKTNTTEGIDAGVANRASTLIDAEGKQQSLRWVESQIDALDIDIALQHFDEAVARTERLRKITRNIKGNVVAQEITNLKLDQRAVKLGAILTRRLKDANSSASVVREKVGWLIRLGYEELARRSYLEARKEVLRKRTRQLPFTGSLPPHLTALSYVTFTLILHTFRTFSSSFPPAASSSVVKWAKERIDEFNESLERQLSSVERGSPLWFDCVDVVKHQSEVLREVGVDFSGLVAKGMVDDELEQDQHMLPAELSFRGNASPP